MTSLKIKTRFLLFLLVLTPMVQPVVGQVSRNDKKAAKVEKKADSYFVRQEFEMAMYAYESIFKEKRVDLTPEYQTQLQLKIARLYTSMLNYSSSIKHYESVMAINDKVMTVEDVCNYLDALRYTGEVQKALLYCRQHAYQDVYSKTQRYLNILQALSYQSRSMLGSGNEFNVRRLDINSESSEYWIGRYKDDMFFATSRSQFHDGSKRFYHRTKFYSIFQEQESAKKQEKTKGVIPYIPVDLQSGPVAFSDDYNTMIITEITYGGNEKIRMSREGLVFYNTKLNYSKLDPKGGRGWSAFTPAFPQDENFSYAHPFLFNDEKTLVFSSNAPGGFGGFDLYIAKWNESIKSWDYPANLGPSVNTEGDEIGARFFDGKLIFASNGHIGFGGYDIYSVIYENDAVMPGSLVHFGAPVNTVYNDFSLYQINDREGFFISDRSTKNGDDVYHYKRLNANESAAVNNAFAGMGEQNAIANGTMAILNMNKTGNIDASSKAIKLPENIVLESLYTVYFDFDSHKLDNLAIQKLQEFADTFDFDNIQSLHIVGYADEMGAHDYNYKLSLKRSQVVAEYLNSIGIEVPVVAEGLGQLKLTDDELQTEAEGLGLYEIFNRSENKYENNYQNSDYRSKMIQLNRKARRVEIQALFK